MAIKSSIIGPKLRFTTKQPATVTSLALAGLLACVQPTALIALGPTPATQPTSAAARVDHIRRTDAVNAQDLMRDGRVLTLSEKVGGAKRAVYFGQLDTIVEDADAPDGQTIVATVPAIVWPDGTRKVGIEVGDKRLIGAAWSYVAAGPSTGEIWAVLDASLEQNQPDVILLHSKNDGQDFELSAVHKPDEHCSFDSFCMTGDGKGRLTVYLAVTGGKSRSNRAGYYHFRTTDGGTTWGAAEREADALRQSDAVDTDSAEQIDPPPPSQRAELLFCVLSDHC